MRVLVVEDDPTIAEFVEKGLREAGFAVDRAADGMTALDRAAREPYDAAIVDVMLPRMDGLALIDTLRARGVRVPVLIMQGATDLQVTADQARELEAAFRGGGNRDVTVRVFPNTNHLFLEDPRGVYSGYATLPSRTIKPEILGVLADWLVAKLRQ